MKNKYIVIATLCLMALGIACEDKSTYPIDFDQLNNSNGGILKQVQQTSVTFDINGLTTTAKYEVVLEANDVQRGKLFTKVEVFVKFVDRTPLNGDASKPEELVQTYQASEFVDDPVTGLPRMTVSHTSAAMMTLLGLSAAPGVDVNGADQFVFRHAMHFPDGRIFTSTNVNSAVSTVPAFFSPFGNIVAVVCPSDLGGVISYSSSNLIVGGGGGPCGAPEPVTGTTTFTVTGPGQYVIGDASFGFWALSCQGYGASIGVTIQDACNSLAIGGADQFTDTYQWVLNSNDGTTLNISWTNTYGDSGDVLLTRAGGWPIGLTIP